jgi:hypothetical protein
MNIHEGQRCFILGTGPSLNSLTQKQLDKLQHEVIFGVNDIYKAKIVESIVPKYYLLMDNEYWEWGSQASRDILKKYESQPPVIITRYKAISLIKKLGIKSDIIFLHDKKYPATKNELCMHKNTYASQNVVETAIKAAMYMGFKEIYLLGCDYTGFISASDHCYEEDEEKSNREKKWHEARNIPLNLALYLECYARATKWHYLLAAYAKKHKIQIINITPGSLLDAYPRMDTSIVL